MLMPEMDERTRCPHCGLAIDMGVARRVRELQAELEHSLSERLSQQAQIVALGLARRRDRERYEALRHVAYELLLDAHETGHTQYWLTELDRLVRERLKGGDAGV